MESISQHSQGTMLSTEELGNAETEKVVIALNIRWHSVPFDSIRFGATIKFQKKECRCWSLAVKLSEKWIFVLNGTCESIFLSNIVLHICTSGHRPFVHIST